MVNLYTENTASYWQEITPFVPARFSSTPPFRYGYPVQLPSRDFIVLPLRELPDRERAVASLIANQASLTVVRSLAEHMAENLHMLGADIIVGLPTLGLVFASLVAGMLGQPRYIPLGYSRKFWYDDALSEPVTSITSPDRARRLRLDPNLLPLLEGRRVALVDDAISTGTTALAAARLLTRLGVRIAGMVVAMKQTNHWQKLLSTLPEPMPVRCVFGCPLFRPGEDGWWPVPESQPEVP